MNSLTTISWEELRRPEGKQPYVVPRELGDDEIPAIVEGFRLAARNAMAAGFDGVEVHGANGYLLDAFLRYSSNHRSGPYGGPIAHRARLLLEVLETVAFGTAFLSNPDLPERIRSGSRRYRSSSTSASTRPVPTASSRAW
ncbi:hypothetical protein [Synechococcus sp. GFB01]|uniref:oxidoreductase n=1 Tax=Synechococcus sp. GFB01 TaxID=1662190 RepID=UPI00064E3F53|nr:hypothetical protein [Synechococcus sp. GFB01]KMM16489.1 hypothetical protein SYNGFB01_10925 [Synechococcus sp. GFB01]